VQLWGCLPPALWALVPFLSNRTIRQGCNIEVASFPSTGIQVDDGEVASDGEITKGRKRRELLRRMKKAGRKPDNGEERALRKVISLCAGT
jgi:hypothetical protein